MCNENRLKGKLALITGATSGIGKSCAEKLAGMGVNLILTGRRTEILNEVKAEIEKKYGVKFLNGDFKKKSRYLKSIEISKEYELYRQDYCGCIFSKLEREKNENIIYK